MRGYSRRRRHGSGLGWVALLLVVLFSVLVVWPTSYAADQTRTCTVTEKDRTSNTNGQSSMRVYTDECGVMEVGDVFFRGIFNSADTYSDIEVGRTYDFRSVGFRVPLFSVFPTIIEVNEK